MLLGNKVSAGSPVTRGLPCCAVPISAVPIRAVPIRAVPCGCGGMGLGGRSACWLGAACLHPPPGSAAFWAQSGPEVTPKVWGGRRGGRCSH